MGKIVLVEREHFLQWILSYSFINDSGYRLIRVNENQTEMWFENPKNKQARIIRLVQKNLDWANAVKRDQQMALVQAEKLRKHLYLRELNILNIYVSPYPPVDEANNTFENILTIKPGKTKFSTLLVTRDNLDESIAKIESSTNGKLEFTLKDQYEESEIFVLRQAVLQKAVMQEKEERSIFEHSKPLFTYILMAIQVVMFLILESKGGSTNSETLIQFGAKYNPLIMEGEWWRFITPVFLHIGFLHLVMNTLALYYLGTAVEKMFGHTRFIWIYLFSGFIGSLASFILSPNLSAGASGAIFGCFGALLYLAVVNTPLFFRTMGMNVIIMIGINLVFGFTVPGIDNAGHIGGLIGGFLATAIVNFPKKRNMKIQGIALLGTLIVTVGCLFIGYQIDRPDVVNAQLQEKMEKGNVDEAYEFASNYIADGKGNAVTYFQLSYLEIQLQKYDDAKQHLLKAIELNPNFHEAHFNISLLYYDEGNYDKAKEHVEKAASLSNEQKYKDFLENISQS